MWLDYMKLVYKAQKAWSTIQYISNTSALICLAIFSLFAVSRCLLCCVDGDVILESSVDPVIEGDTLTLHCLHRSTNSSILGADFYKDGSLVQNQTTGEMNITTVSKSHEGFYSCKTERGQSPKSWISVRGESQWS